jgi:AraC family transcriptional regulator
MPQDLARSEYSPITLGRVVRTRRTGVLTFTHAEHAPHTALADHAHERANLTLVVSGSFGERLPRESLSVGPNDIVIKAAGVRHANDYGNRPARSITVEIDESWLCRAGASADVLTKSAQVRSAPAAEALLRLVPEMGCDDSASAGAMEELVLDALAALARVPLSDRRSSWIGDVRAFLDEHYLEAVSLTTVAETFGIERTHLARVFRRDIGTTVGGYIRMLRVQHACRQLASTSRSITDIAAATGFADHAHLCRVFKSSVGATPSEFRRLQS